MAKRVCCQSLQEKLGGEQQHYSDTRSTFREKGKEIRMDELRNKKKYCFVHFEEVVNPKSDTGNQNESKRPDVLVRVCEEEEEDRFFFVELKGTGIPAKIAYKQIVQGINHAKQSGLNCPKISTYGVIVGSRMPSSNDWRDLKDQFKKRHGRDLIRANTAYSIPLNSQ